MEVIAQSGFNTISFPNIYPKHQGFMCFARILAVRDLDQTCKNNMYTIQQYLSIGTQKKIYALFLLNNFHKQHHFCTSDLGLDFKGLVFKDLVLRDLGLMVLDLKDLVLRTLDLRELYLKDLVLRNLNSNYLVLGNENLRDLYLRLLVLRDSDSKH